MAARRDQQLSEMQQSGFEFPWACGTCTFLNASYPQRCELCQSNNPAWEPALAKYKAQAQEIKERHALRQKGNITQIDSPDQSGAVEHECNLVVSNATALDRDRCEHSAATDQSQGEGGWPTLKMTSRLSKLAADGPVRLAVLLTTGGHNPVHQGHVSMLHQAATRVEQQGYTVVGSWLSPSHDLYLQPKAQHLGTIGLSSDLRLELARRAVRNDPLVAVSSWEATRDEHWPDYPEVCEALQEFVAKNFQNDITTFYVCGSDHAENCGLCNGLSPEDKLGVVVVPRAGDSPISEGHEDLVFVADAAAGDVAAMSSTKVRTAMQDADLAYLEQALSPEAAQLLLTPTVTERALFAYDFDKLGRTPGANLKEPPSITPIFLSNSALSRNAAQRTCDVVIMCIAGFFEEVPTAVRDKCILFFGSESHQVFGKAGPEYDEFIRQRQEAGKFHSLKPVGWQAGQRCDFRVASQFLEQLGYNALHLDMGFYEQHLDMENLFCEAVHHLGGQDKEGALLQIKENLEEAISGTGFYGHDYGPVLQMVRMADERLYPILSDDGLKDYLKL